MPITNDELQEMQDPDAWSIPVDAVTPGRGEHARAIVAVAFNRDEFQRLHACAAERGVTLSELIRDAVFRQIEEPRG